MVEPTCDLDFDHEYVVQAGDGNNLRLKRSNRRREIGVAWHPCILLPRSLLVQAKKTSALLLESCRTACGLQLRAEVRPASATRDGYEQRQQNGDGSACANAAYDPNIAQRPGP